MAKQLRPLSDREYELAKWMLEHAQEDMSMYLAQLESASVASVCDCGCNSLEFKIKNKPAPDGCLEILAEYTWGYQEKSLMVFIYQMDEQLAGIEIVPMDDNPLLDFPTPDQLIAYSSESD